jgi:hypothetical protein
VSARVRSLPERTVRVGADAFNESITARVRTDTGGDMKLSGFGGRSGKGTRIATTTRISGGGRIATATIRLRGAQAAILEKGARPHTVGRRRDGKGGLHMNVGGWKTGPWRVSGSPAKQTFTKGIDDGRAAARSAMDAELSGAIRG